MEPFVPIVIAAFVTAFICFIVGLVFKDSYPKVGLILLLIALIIASTATTICIRTPIRI